ncbi:MAG: NAD-binding protein [Rickettsiales bacterium]|nr:NAD-binding protein [Rickettsiales bacterium]
MKKINWGILSTAKIARQHVVPAINKSKNSILYAVASRNKKKSLNFAKKFKIKNFYSSYKELYEDKNIDIIYNPLPNHLHLQTTIDACNHKKHVLLEKPITLRAKDVDKLIKVSKKNKVIIKEAFMVRYHPQWNWIKNLISKGEIGKVKSISTVFSFYNNDPKNIRNVRNYGGGSIYDIGCYPVLISRYLLQKEPTQVVANSVIDKKFKTDTMTTGILDFDGIHSSFICSTQANYTQQVVILGTKKTIIFENPFNPKPNRFSNIMIYKGSSIYRQDNQLKKFLPVDQYKNQIDYFSDIVLKRKKIDYSLTDSKKNMKVLDALFKSLKTKTWARIKK